MQSPILSVFPKTRVIIIGAIALCTTVKWLPAPEPTTTAAGVGTAVGIASFALALGQEVRNAVGDEVRASVYAKAKVAGPDGDDDKGSAVGETVFFVNPGGVDELDADTGLVTAPNDRDDGNENPYSEGTKHHARIAIAYHYTDGSWGPNYILAPTDDIDNPPVGKPSQEFQGWAISAKDDDPVKPGEPTFAAAAAAIAYDGKSADVCFDVRGERREDGSTGFERAVKLSQCSPVPQWSFEDAASCIVSENQFTFVNLSGDRVLVHPNELEAVDLLHKYCQLDSSVFPMKRGFDGLALQLRQEINAERFAGNEWRVSEAANTADLTILGASVSFSDGMFIRRGRTNLELLEEYLLSSSVQVNSPEYAQIGYSPHIISKHIIHPGQDIAHILGRDFTIPLVFGPNPNTRAVGILVKLSGDLETALATAINTEHNPLRETALQTLHPDMEGMIAGTVEVKGLSFHNELPYTIDVRNTALPQGTINISQIDSGQAMIDWGGERVLETSVTLKGPWKEVSNVARPYKVALNEGERFWRSGGNRLWCVAPALTGATTDAIIGAASIGGGTAPYAAVISFPWGDTDEYSSTNERIDFSVKMPSRLSKGSRWYEVTLSDSSNPIQTTTVGGIVTNTGEEFEAHQLFVPKQAPGGTLRFRFMIEGGTPPYTAIVPQRLEAEPRMTEVSNLGIFFKFDVQLPLEVGHENREIPITLADARGEQTSIIAAFDLIPEVPSEDSDEDGIDDVWELEFFGNLEQTGSEDPDNDGRSNLQEFQTGTNPNVADEPAQDVPALLEPVPGVALLGGSVVKLSYTANNTTLSSYSVHVGTSVGSLDLFNSGFLPANQTTVEFEIPNEEQAIYVRLWWLDENEEWRSVDYEFQAAKSEIDPPGKIFATFENPENGDVFHLVGAKEENRGLTYEQVEAMAMAVGGRAWIPKNAEENDLVADAFSDCNYIRIALSDREAEGIFVSAAGELPAVQIWNKDEPNDFDGGEDYVVMFNFVAGNPWFDVKDASMIGGFPVWAVVKME